MVAQTDLIDNEEAPRLPEDHLCPQPAVVVGPIIVPVLTPAPPAAVASSATARLTLTQRALRSLLVLAAALIGIILLAPLVTAAVAAIWALVTDAFSVATIVRLIMQGNLLQTGAAMNALSIASRIGFVAIGYLGLFYALVALLAGLLGRGKGRLFIIPGALLSASALLLFAVSIALSWPLIALLHLPHPLLLGGAIYLALDTIALATLLADTRETRRAWLAQRRASRPARPAAFMAGRMREQTTRSV